MPEPRADFDPAGLLQSLARHRVRYVVVGGIGGVLHGSPLPTDDLDIVPDPKVSNLDALAGALKEMHARVLSQEAPDGIEVDFTGQRLRKWIVDFRFLSLATACGQLDVIHRPAGTGGYHELASNAEAMELGDVDVRVAALEDIIRSKQAAARDRDLEQLPTLRLLLERKRSTELDPGEE